MLSLADVPIPLVRPSFELREVMAAIIINIGQDILEPDTDAVAVARAVQNEVQTSFPKTAIIVNYHTKHAKIPQTEIRCYMWASGHTQPSLTPKTVDVIVYNAFIREVTK